MPSTVSACIMLGPTFALSRGLTHSVKTLTSVAANRRSGVVRICDAPPHRTFRRNRRFQQPEQFNGVANKSFRGLFKAVGADLFIGPLNTPDVVINSHAPVGGRGDYTLDRPWLEGW